jgi:hypothetical protein
MELIIGAVIIVGLIYWFAAGKKKEFAVVIPPEEVRL